MSADNQMVVDYKDESWRCYMECYSSGNILGQIEYREHMELTRAYYKHKNFKEYRKLVIEAYQKWPFQMLKHFRPLRRFFVSFFLERSQ